MEQNHTKSFRIKLAVIEIKNSIILEISPLITAQKQNHEGYGVDLSQKKHQNQSREIKNVVLNQKSA